MTVRGRIFKRSAVWALSALILVLTVCSSPRKEVEQAITLGAMEDFVDGMAGDNGGASLVFDTMLAYERGNVITPFLIESWSMENDDKTYAFTLRPEVFFTDGTPLTSEIAWFSIKYWAPYKFSNVFEYFDHEEILDDLHFKIHLERPYSAFLDELVDIPATKPSSVDNSGNIIEFTGTGPFILENYQRGQSATLKRNDNYWNSAQKPLLERVTWQVIPDANARVLALRSGTVDAIGVTEHHLSIPYSAVADLRTSNNLAMVSQESGTTNAEYVYNYLRGPMTDSNLRQAVTYAIDRETLANQVLQGIPVANGHYIPLDNKFAPVNEMEHRYDPVLAKQRLAQAGYEDANGDGIVEKNGKNLRLVLLVSSGATADLDAVFIQSNLKAIGIDVEIVALDSNLRGERAKQGEFDISYTHPWLLVPYSYLVWRGSFEGYDEFGASFLVDPARQRPLMEQISMTMDEAARTELWNQQWKILYDFWAGTSLYTNRRIIAHQANITGFAFNQTVTKIDISKVRVN
jgi:ABC-type transport system substrate-binding protein